jgi:hypothetical protein
MWLSKLKKLIISLKTYHLFLSIKNFKNYSSNKKSLMLFVFKG